MPQEFDRSKSEASMKQKARLDVIKDTLSKKYPDTDFRHLEMNGRAVRFWADNGDAKTAIVTSKGIVCFTGEEALIPWSDDRLLGEGKAPVSSPFDPTPLH